MEEVVAGEQKFSEGSRKLVGRENSVYEDYDKPITAEDIKEIRSIGRKSINDFSSEDIQKTQKWAYKFYKELGTKSPFFRAWFGDWRQYDLDTHILYIPVNTDQITIQDIDKSGAKNKDTGWKISVTRNGIDETANKNQKWSIAYHSLKNINDMLENSVYVDTDVIDDPSYRMDKTAVFIHHMYCPISVDGEYGIAKLYVTENISDEHKFYLTKIEMESLDSMGQGKSGDPKSSNDSDISIAGLYEFVKTHNTVYGKDGLTDYLNKEIRNENIVRIKNESNNSSERLAPIASGYANTAFENNNTTNSEIRQDVSENSSEETTKSSERSSSSDSNRALLANAMLDLAQDERETKMLKRYQNQIRQQKL